MLIKIDKIWLDPQEIIGIESSYVGGSKSQILLRNRVTYVTTLTVDQVAEIIDNYGNN